jgi:hypothetical protein
MVRTGNLRSKVGNSIPRSPIGQLLNSSIYFLFPSLGLFLGHFPVKSPLSRPQLRRYSSQSYVNIDVALRLFDLYFGLDDKLPHPTAITEITLLYQFPLA